MAVVVVELSPAALQAELLSLDVARVIVALRLAVANDRPVLVPGWRVDPPGSVAPERWVCDRTTRGRSDEILSSLTLYAERADRPVDDGVVTVLLIRLESDRAMSHVLDGVA